MGCRPHTKRPITPETAAPQDWILPVLEKGQKKRTAIDSTVSNTRIFLHFCPFLPRPTTNQSSMASTTCKWSRRPPRPSKLATRTLNIQDIRGFGLAQAIWAVELWRFDVMLLTETNIHSKACSHNQLSCNVTCLAARPSSVGEAQGGVGLVTREWPDGWGIEFYALPQTERFKL